MRLSLIKLGISPINEFTLVLELFTLRITMTKKASDIQIGGEHYKKLKHSPLDFILANNLSYCLGQVVKYICRDKDKVRFVESKTLHRP